MEIINKFRPELNLDAACKIFTLVFGIQYHPTITLGFLLASVEVMMTIVELSQVARLVYALICVWLVVFRQKNRPRPTGSLVFTISFCPSM